MYARIISEILTETQILQKVKQVQQKGDLFDVEAIFQLKKQLENEQEVFEAIDGHWGSDDWEKCVHGFFDQR